MPKSQTTAKNKPTMQHVIKNLPMNLFSIPTARQDENGCHIEPENAMDEINSKRDEIRWQRIRLVLICAVCFGMGILGTIFSRNNL